MACTGHRYQQSWAGLPDDMLAQRKHDLQLQEPVWAQVAACSAVPVALWTAPGWDLGTLSRHAAPSSAASESGPGWSGEE